MQEVDIIIKNGLVITIDSNSTIYSKGHLVIDKGVIVEITDDESVLTNYQSKKSIDASSKLIMPGFVNTHTHTGNTIYRGFADDMPLKKWLEEYIFPVESKFCTIETVRLSAQLSIIEMLRGGTTCFSDMYYFEDEVAKVCDEIGMRAELGETLLDFPSPTAPNSDVAIDYTEELITNWNAHELVTIAITPHAPYTCNDDTLVKSKKLAEKYDVPYHMHVSESKYEVQQSLEKHNATPVKHLDDLGLWKDGDFAVHCVHLTEEDRELLKEKGIAVAHNPRSNMKLSSGIAPIQDLINRGILCGMGTDGTASNNNLNMIKEMDTAAMLSKVHTMDPTSLDAKTMVQMGTINGASLLGLDDKIGSLEKGKSADVIIIDLNQAQLIPMYDPYSHIVYSMNGSEVETTIVNGNILMENRQLNTINEEKILTEVKILQEKIKKEF